MKKNRLLPFLAAVCVLLGMMSCLAGCTGGGGADKPTGAKITGEWALPELEFENDTCVVLASDGSGENEELRDLMLSEYGLKIETVTAPWNEVQSKLAALVAAGDSPDVYNNRAEISIIVSDLIQPVDPYVDLSHKYYDKFRDYYDSNIWNGSHYGLYSDVYYTNTVYYNTKLFEDAGLEDPWDLYEQGKWNFDAFAEAAEELTQDTNDDGETDVYGFCFNRPACWAYVMGEPFAYFDQENMKLQSNMTSAKLAEAMNFIYDLINVKNLGYKASDTVELFNTGGAAMMPNDGAFGISSFKTLVENKTLGVVPFPTANGGDTHYARDLVSAVTIPVGSANPTAAVAMNACYLYLNYYKDGVIDQKWADIQAEGDLSDELVERLRICHGESNNQPDNVKGVQEHLELLGYNCTWETIYWGVPWATAMENRRNEMESLLAAATEKVLPMNSPLIEDFEAITTGGITTPITGKLLAVPGGSASYELYLDGETKANGLYGGIMYYDVSDVGWGGFKKEISRQWDEYNAMSLWLKGDGSAQTLTVTFVDAKTTAWSYDITLEGDTAQTVVIPFADFKLPEYLDGLGVTMDLSKITEFRLTAKGEGEHSFNVDDICVVFQ